MGKILQVFLLFLLLTSTYCQYALQQKLETEGKITVQIKNNNIQPYVGQGWHQGTHINLDNINYGSDVYGRPSAQTLTITKINDQHGGYTIKSQTKLWVPLLSSGFRSTSAPIAEELLSNTRWTVSFHSENEIRLSLGPSLILRSTYPENNPFYKAGSYVGELYGSKYGFYWSYNSDKGGAQYFQVNEVEEEGGSSGGGSSGSGGTTEPPSANDIEQRLEQGPIQVKIRCDALLPDVGAGWHTGIHINLSNTLYGKDQYGRPEEEILTITKKTDSHGGYTIKSSTKLWVPYSSSGFRTSTAPVSQESHANTRWNIEFLSGNSMSLSLGPKRVMKQDYPTYNENYVAPSYIGNIYAKYSGIYWNYEQDKGQKQVFQFIEV